MISLDAFSRYSKYEKIGNLSEDSGVLITARKEAQKIILEDPGFELSKNKIIVSHIKKNKSLNLNWSRIS